MRFRFKYLLAAASIVVSTGALAQAYPSKPIRFVIGFPAGSSIDNVSRVVLDNIRERTGATIVIENRPGALGALGVEAVTKAPSDGYTMMPSSSATNSSGPHLARALQKLDVVRGLTHLGRVVRFDIAIVTSASQNFKTAKALIDEAKAKPDVLTYGYGSGTGQLASAAFGHAAGVQVRGIPYKGQPQAIADLMGGQVNFVGSDLGAVLALVRARSLVAIAVASEKRSTILPDVPTTAEVGLRGMTLVGWIGISGPSKLPADVVKWWGDQLKLSLAANDVLEKLRNQGMEPDVLVGEPFVQFVAAEFEQWGKHVTNAGIKPE